MINIKVKERVSKKKRDDYKSLTMKKQKLRNYFRSELITSTTHGLPYIVNTELHWIERVFWVISFASSTGLVFYVLVSQYLRFIETPIVMSVEMDYFNWNVSYPAFTLCPALKPNPEAFMDLLNQTSERMGVNLESYLWSILAASMDTLNLLDLQSPEILPLIDPNQYALIAAMVFKEFNYQSTTTNTNCPITVDQAMTENGMCHVLNSNVASFDNPTEWGNGMKKPYRKSNIELSFHDKNFFTQIIDYSQIYQVFIHSPDETILTTSPSYTLSLKGFMSFGVQVWSTKISDELRAAPMRLRKCRFINEPISDRYPIYSYNHCMLECKIKMIIELCGCIPHFYKPLDHERICNLGELQCVLDHKKEISSLSTSEATLEEFPNSQALPRSPRDCECISTCETDVYLKESESFEPQTFYSRLRIGISSFPKVRIVRDFIFSFYDVILRSGGVVNLCIGTSLLSLVELFMTVIRIPLRNVGQAFKRLISKIRK